jgi:hypothetical protein
LARLPDRRRKGSGLSRGKLQALWRLDRPLPGRLAGPSREGGTGNGVRRESRKALEQAATLFKTLRPAAAKPKSRPRTGRLLQRRQPERSLRRRPPGQPLRRRPPGGLPLRRPQGGPRGFVSGLTRQRTAAPPRLAGPEEYPEIYRRARRRLAEFPPRPTAACMIFCSIGCGGRRAAAAIGFKSRNPKPSEVPDAAGRRKTRCGRRFRAKPSFPGDRPPEGPLKPERHAGRKYS